MDDSKSTVGGGCPSFITYVVFGGKTPGIYPNVEDCNSQMSGFPDSRLQAFDDPNNAISAWLKFCSRTSKNEFSTEAGGLHPFHGAQCSPVEWKKLLPMSNNSDGCHTPSDLENLSSGGGPSTSKSEVVDLSTEVREVSLALKQLSLLVNDSDVENKVLKSRINNLQSTMDELKVSVANIVETIISEGGSALKNTHAQRPAPAKPLDGKETTTTNVMHMNIDECEEDFDTEENLKCIVKNKSCQGKTGVNADTSPGQGLGWPYRKTGKKLFSSPGTPDRRQSKAAKTDNLDATSPAVVTNPRKGKNCSRAIGSISYSENSELDYTSNYTGGYILPDGILSTFPPTRDMLLFRAEFQVAAYVFHPGMAPCEVILRMGKKKVTREDFNCFREGNVISYQMISLMAMRATHMQRDSNCPIFWALPPSFADSVSNEQTVQELSNYYGHTWMPPFDRLSHIYLPILDEYGYWFLAVISLKDRVVFHVDSNLNHEQRKRKIISTMCAKVSDIISMGNHSSYIKRMAAQFLTWDIKMATGTPDCGSSETSADWVLYWLRLNMSSSRGQTDHDFSGHFVCDYKYHKMRMLSALALLMDTTNEMRLELLLTAELKWPFIKNGE